MGKVHWPMNGKSIWDNRAWPQCGSGYGVYQTTTDPNKVTCRHPACVKAAKEAKEQPHERGGEE